MNELVINEVPEDYYLEYKSEIDFNNPDHKRKLLKTVSAFANTNGGLLIYGITESGRGIPEALQGFSCDNADETIRALTSIIRNRSEPTITIFEPYYFHLSDSNKIILIIKVPKSWRGPHRVKMNGKKDFYLRIKNKSEPMDVEDLRNSFNLSETLFERIKQFRENRISDLYINNTPIPFVDGAKLVIHLIPLNAFNPGQLIDINSNLEYLNQITYVGAHGFSTTFNMDGIISYTSDFIDEQSYSYVQFFRNGILEIVYGHEILDNARRRHISAIYNESHIVNSISRNIQLFNEIGVQMPFYIFISLLNAKDFEMPTNNPFGERRIPKIYKDIFMLPEVLLNSYEANIGDSLRNSFNVVWNAFGRDKSPNYDENGQWNPQR